jgi:CBS domain containing-hemolysin-like protein
VLVLLLSFGAALALVLVNGVLVAAEFAIVRVRRTRLEELAGHGRLEATHAIELVDEMSEYLTTTQVGITAASLGVGWIGEGAFARLFVLLLPGSSGALVHAAAGSVAFGLVTMLHVVLGEIVPKNLAIARSDEYLLALAGPLRLLHRTVRPISRLFMASAAGIQGSLGHVNRAPPALSEDELKLVLTDSHEDGVLTEGEANIILRAFEFSDKCACEIMVPAERVDYLTLARSFEENFEVARKHMHARLPLCDGDLHSVRGIVGMKDVLLLRFGDSNEAFVRACRPLLEIPHDLSQEEILRRFQAEGVQMAVVRDASNRRTVGVVTLEDVLESLVGDVREARLGGGREVSPG